MTEARALSRPAVLLKEKSDELSPLAAVWGGVGLVSLPAALVVEDQDEIDDGAFYRHWLSVDSSFLPSELGFGGCCVSIYWNADLEVGHVAYNPQVKLSTEADQVSLYACKRDDLPFIDVVFMAGSPRLREWAANEVKYSFEYGYGNNFYDEYADDTLKAQLDELLTWHSENQPMWAANAAAQIGGWPWSWPDGLWNEREKQGWKLVLWTFRNSEPWLEVWWKSGQFEMVARIT